VAYGVITKIMYAMYSIKIVMNLVCTHFVRVLGWGSLKFARPVHTQDSRQTHMHALDEIQTLNFGVQAIQDSIRLVP
jgi:hypothetical protein